MKVRRRPSDPGRPIDYVAFGGDLGRVPFDDGYRAGYDAGYEAGRGEALAAHDQAESERTADVARALGSLDDAVAAIRRAFEERQSELDTELPGFVFELVEAMIGHEASHSVDPGRDAIARALDLDGTGRPVAVRLHPEDLAVLGELDELAGVRTISVTADATVVRGGAIVDIGETTIDSDLTAALQRLRAVLAPGRPGDSP